MDTTRRAFLERIASASALLGVAPLSLAGSPLTWAAPPADDAWDLSWVQRLTGKHKAVFDVPGIESGYGVWRASLWARQYHEVLGIPASDLSAVVVIRHDAIVLALQQSFWDTYAIGETKKVLHPMTQAVTDRNPVLLSSARGEIPPEFDDAMLPKLIERGGIALACNLAFGDCVDLVQKKDGVSADAARKRAIGYLVPGVLLQPSGVFAAIRAQEAGCIYLRAS
jgi:hypothetical protein